MPELTNDDRADNAQQAVSAYCTATRFRPDDDDPHELIQDLLGDLQHLADRKGVDFAQALRMGTSAHEEEKREEECEHQPDDDPESGDRCKDCGAYIERVEPDTGDRETADN